MVLKRMNWHALQGRVYGAMLAKSLQQVQTGLSSVAAAQAKPAAAPAVNPGALEKLGKLLEKEMDSHAGTKRKLEEAMTRQAPFYSICTFQTLCKNLESPSACQIPKALLCGNEG